MTRPTDERLDELARLEAGATPGEWYGHFRAGAADDGYADVSANDEKGTFVVATVMSGSVEQCDRDRKFIIAARNALPVLLAELRLLRRLGEAMEQHSVRPVVWQRTVGPALEAWREWKREACPP